MTMVTMGIAGVENTTVTMFNSQEEDNFLTNKAPKDMHSAQFGMARKRLMGDAYPEKVGNETLWRPHAADTVMFPISTK